MHCDEWRSWRRFLPYYLSVRGLDAGMAGWLAERKTKHRNSFSVPSDQILLPVIPELTARSINITAAPLLSLSAIRRVFLGALHCPPPSWLVIYNVKEWNSWQEKIVFQQRVELFIPASLVFHRIYILYRMDVCALQVGGASSAARTSNGDIACSVISATGSTTATGKESWRWWWWSMFIQRVAPRRRVIAQEYQEAARKTERKKAANHRRIISSTSH